jgi:hypothetical protein
MTWHWQFLLAALPFALLAFTEIRGRKWLEWTCVAIYSVLANLW